MRHVLVTGAMTPLGRGLVARLREDPEIEKVIGVEPRSSSAWIDGAELVAFEPDDRELARFIDEQKIDSVVHCAMTPSRSGSAEMRGPADVISTMRLCAAVSNPRGPVRSLVLISSSEVFVADAHAPLFSAETDPVSLGDEEPAASLIEAEEYARDVAGSCAHLNVAILRFAEMVGGGMAGALSASVAGPLVPAPIGFDAPVQWLHGDDAIAAVLFAARTELAGVYNVASRDIVRWSDVLATVRHFAVPVLPFELGPLIPLLEAVGFPHVREGAGPQMRYGSALDTEKLARAGFRPRFDQRDCLAALGPEAQR